MPVRTVRHNPYVPCVFGTSAITPTECSEPDISGVSSTSMHTSSMCDEAGPAWGYWYPGAEYTAFAPEAPCATNAPPRSLVKDKRRRRPICETPEDKVADHYKTKMCNSFQAKGWCPYDQVCRFAHGADDLHTYSQNIRLGLTTEEAVRDYQRYRITAARWHTDNVEV